jgi:putative acetyltransferase
VLRVTRLRHATDEDSAAVCALISAVYTEYPNCHLVLDEEPDLRAPASSYAKKGGKFWVAEDDQGLLGTVGILPDGGDVLLMKLYVSRRARGTGLGKKLIALVEEEARARGAKRIHLWTDTRFETAHRVYEHLGYVKLPGRRALGDVSQSIELHYEKRFRQ